MGDCGSEFEVLQRVQVLFPVQVGQRWHACRSDHRQDAMIPQPSLLLERCPCCAPMLLRERHHALRSGVRPKPSALQCPFWPFGYTSLSAGSARACCFVACEVYILPVTSMLDA